MDIEDLRKKKPDALKKTLLELRREQFDLRMSKNSGQLTRTHELREKRTNIARIKTVLNEQQRAAAAE